ncbi:AI-2E family transporter [Natronorarus salvus]|uniref:AI-2E family transporter n=1 Tax=Natronorarus salvus TaxID=3117733 RepID=UPI002F26C98E
MNQQRAFVLLAIAISALVSLWIVLPFLQYVLAAVILAYVLFPIHARLAPRIGRRASPVLLIVLTLVAVILPLIYVGTVLYRDLLELAQGETALDAETLEARIEESTGQTVDVQSALVDVGEALVEVLFGSVTQVVGVTFTATLGLALTLFLVYYTLRDGPAFVDWAADVIPLPPDVTADLFDQIHRTTWGVVIGHISVAVIQGLVGGVGLYFAGVPNVVFWTFVMIVLALLPLIGAFIIWGPAAIYLVAVDQVVPGVALAVYGIVVVSMIDNYARPIVIDREAHLNPGVILVGVFGGVYTLGFTGLFIGPIVIGVLAATLATFREDYDRL